MRPTIKQLNNERFPVSSFRAVCHYTDDDIKYKTSALNPGS